MGLGRGRSRFLPGAGVLVSLTMVLPASGCDSEVGEAKGTGAGAPVVVARASSMPSVAAIGGGVPSGTLLPSALDLDLLGYDQGDADAPLKVIEITDFGCGYCRRFNQETFPVLLEEYIETGRVEWKFVPFVLGMFPNGDKAALAGECAGEQGRKAFLPMRDLLFAHQAGWRATEDPNEFFTGLAGEAGLDTEAFSACLAEDRRGAQVELNNRLGKALGVQGTPLFIIGGIPVPGAQPLDQFRQIFETILAEGESFPSEWLPHPPTPGGPSVTERVLASEHGYTLGSPDAPLEIVEFSDFGCGYCRLFQEQTRPELLKEYVETGLVRWTYVPFVLGIFPNGDAAAVASECAGYQGLFEPVRERLYRDQAGWRGADDPGVYFTRIAEEEGLDAQQFSRCLTETAASTRVWENVQLGRMAGVKGAPAFLVDGFLVSGAKPLETFRDLLDLKLSSLVEGN
jgi:protein-disulfide isomerase